MSDPNSSALDPEFVEETSDTQLKLSLVDPWTF